VRTGTLVSGAGHGALVALAVFGMPWFSARERPPIQVTEVSFVSEAAFDAAQSAAPAPRDPEAPAATPSPVVEPPEVLPEPTPPQAADAPPTPEAEAPPPLASLEPSFNAEAPLAAAPEGLTLAPPAPTVNPVAPPRPRPVERIEATPTPPPPEVARPAPTPTPERSSEPTPEPPPVAAPEAPPEAAPPPPPSGAVASAEPPPPRPARPTPQQVAAAPEPEPEPEPTQAESVLERLRARQEGATPPTPPTPATETAASTSLPVGPPITSGERDGLRLAVQQCWNVPAGLRDAQELRVTLAAELTATGEVISASIRLIEPESPPDGRFQQAFEAGRRALIRCSPYTDLPQEKYAQWRNIEVVFNPEGMVSW
jgi:hypothetical protein